MKNKGFTLIELLAVIVILAIIALIATPIILGIINDAREQAKKRSAELVYTGVEYAYTTAMYKGAAGTTIADPDLTSIKNNLNIDNMQSATIADDTLTIVTSDGVTCTVEEHEGSSTVAFDVACGTNGDLLSKTIPALAEEPEEPSEPSEPEEP